MTFILIFLFLFFPEPLSAQLIDHDSFEAGVEAFNAGNFEEALRIMKPFEKSQPTASYIINMSSLMIKKKNQEQANYDGLVQELLKKGDVSIFEKLGLIKRYKGQLNHLSGRRLLNNLSMQANAGDPNAAFQMGLFFQEGTSVRKNFTTASNFFKIAVKKNHAEAQNSLGFYKRFGIGTEKKEKEAEELFKESLLQENPFAFYNLSLLYLDKKNFLNSFILSEMGKQRIDEEKDKKTYIKFKKLSRKSKKKLSEFHKAYYEQFRPAWLASVMKKETTQGIQAPERLPYPPEKMIEETPFMKIISKDIYDNRYKKFEPLMPNWISFDEPTELNPLVLEKTPLAPSPDDEEVLNALYFRPAAPRSISLTLSRENSAIPAMVGDVLTVYVYTPLHADEQTKKGGGMYLKNTDYSIFVENRSGFLKQENITPLLPLSPKTAKEEAWIAQKVRVEKAGDAIIRFVPRERSGFEKNVPYNLRVVGFKAKPIK